VKEVVEKLSNEKLAAPWRVRAEGRALYNILKGCHGHTENRLSTSTFGKDDLSKKVAGVMDLRKKKSRPWRGKGLRQWGKCSQIRSA